MTLYLLFAGLGILIYTGIARADAAVSSFSRALVAFGLPFVSIAWGSMFIVAAILRQSPSQRESFCRTDLKPRWP
jgi:hypothetical protein